MQVLIDERFQFTDYAVKPVYCDVDPPVFSGSDTKELFSKNLRTMPMNWHYRTKEVYYIRNKLGFRTKDIEDLDKGSYFLAYGCSFTEGVGLAEDETWPYKLGKLLSMDYLNLGVGGGSPDLVHLQSISYVSNVTGHKPKFVIIQWPSQARQIVKNLKEFVPIVPNVPYATKEASNQYHWSVKTNSFLYDSYMAYMSTQGLWKAFGVPVFNWAIDGEWNNIAPLVKHIYPNDAEVQLENMARDLMHFGNIYQDRVAKELKKQITRDPKFRSAPG